MYSILRPFTRFTNESKRELLSNSSIAYKSRFPQSAAYTIIPQSLSRICS